MNRHSFDSQAALGFLEAQTAHIEQGVYEIQYADIQYAELIPVDTSAHPMAKTVTYYSMDKAGLAAWMNGNASDVPLADVEHARHETTVHTAGIGYSYGYEEIQQAMMLGINLTSDKAAAARRAYEEFVDNVALNGDASKGFEGLFNNSNVTANPATNGDWDSATPDEVLQDVNDLLGSVQTSTNNVGLANTLLLPYTKWNTLATTRLTDSQTTLLKFLQEHNVYTARTGQPLTMRGITGLDTAGISADPRMIAYRRHPQVLKMHIPMPHQFFSIWQDGPFNFMIPGMFRIGGLDIRLPKEVAYGDGI